jgi:hypothetical protein
MVLFLFMIYLVAIVLVSFIDKPSHIYLHILLATFCALYTMNEQMEIEGTLNIYELAKLYHIKRPGIWRHNVRDSSFFK